VDQDPVGAVHPALGRAVSIPTILSVRFMLNPEWGVINTTIFKLTGLDGPNWLNDPTLALASRC
jgi:ABC-type sugar transport system permease subunit